MCRASRSRKKGAARVCARTVQRGVCIPSPHTGQTHGPCSSGSSAAWVFARTVSVIWHRTGHQHGACSRGVCADFRCGTGRAELNTDRVKRLHGSWFRLHGACSNDFFSVARGVQFLTGQVHFFTGHAISFF